MKKGSNIAREMGNGLHADVLDHFKEQLLIVFLKRLDEKISIPLKEVDDTGQDGLALRIDKDKIFHFEIIKKN